jgi:hypothetical protein
MVFVSDETRRRFPGAAEDLAKMDGFVKDYESRVRLRFVPENPSARELSIRDKVVLLLLSTTSTARWLTWTILDALNHDMTPGMYLATRAHLEQTGLLAYLLVQLRRYKEGQLPEQDFSILCNRLMLARRHNIAETIAQRPELKGHVEAINTLTLIDAVDKVFDEPELKGLFRKDYDWLSEFCHPNMFARVATGYRLEGREVAFPEFPKTTAQDADNALGGAVIGHLVFFHCYEKIAELLGGVPGAPPTERSR